MKFLLVAATVSEVLPLIEYYRLRPREQFYNHEKFNLLITGVGMVATAFQLGNHLSTNNYSFGLNAGIAGSFNREIDLGELVNVTEDKFCELGAEDGDRFMPIDELGFGESTIKPMQTNANLTLRHVTSVTVNTVHGNEGTIEALKNRIKADVESMEGASFFYGCNQRNLPSIQIRAISNYIEKRNRENWKIEQAVTNLNTFLIDFISKI